MHIHIDFPKRIDAYMCVLHLLLLIEHIVLFKLYPKFLQRPYRKLTENVEVWKTPGRTQQCLSVLVHNVEHYGTMGIVGDLIPREDYIFNNVRFLFSF
ncbi:unnamed protein product [Gongylonema pulchrum]|uniref:Innexin n=1 Tax=Gongylonema pulchrum TaxID=637853 RepID=A0A183ECT9_9BILA|nr:unnamed protein product [Gongylonema pulchrum]